MSLQTTRALLDFIEKSPSCFHAIANLQAQLDTVGFVPLREEQLWYLEPGGKYYVTRNGSSLLTFCLPACDFTGFRIVAAHSDSPCFKVKENPEIGGDGLYVRLDVERYGGMLYAPWLDRPLSVAGRITVKTAVGMETHLVHLDRDLLMIPNVAIHLNRKANDGYVYNPQIDLLPLFSQGKASGAFLRQVAQAAGVQAENIVGTDLFLYPRVKGTIWGSENEFTSSRALDDLQCAWSAIQGLLSSGNPKQVTMCAIFDNEEVGSCTRQGADSTFLTDTIERIGECCGCTAQRLRAAIANSFMLSADNGHAVHPNHPELSGSTNRPTLNGGIVIKYNANQKYCTDAVSAGIFRCICEKAGVPCQTYANRNDLPGGSTLGNLSTRHLAINTVDIGLAQLAMHSPYETCGTQDTNYLVDGCKAFFSAMLQCDGHGGYEIL